MKIDYLKRYWIGTEMFPRIKISKEILKFLSREYKDFRPHLKRNFKEDQCYCDILDIGISQVSQQSVYNDLEDYHTIEFGDNEYIIDECFAGVCYGITHHTDMADPNGFSLMVPLTTREYIFSSDSEHHCKKFGHVQFKSSELHSLMPVGRQLDPFLFLLIDYRKM